MSQLDKTFLTDLELTNLPEDKQQQILQQLQTELEERVGEKLTAAMSEGQLAEFDALLDGDQEKVKQWLGYHVPAYEQTDDYKELLSEMGITKEQSVSTDVLSSYVVTKWLEVNSPEYQKTVEETLEELKEEITHNRDMIMSKNEE